MFHFHLTILFRISQWRCCRLDSASHQDTWVVFLHHSHHTRKCWTGISLEYFGMAKASFSFGPEVAESPNWLQPRVKPKIVWFSTQTFKDFEGGMILDQSDRVTFIKISVQTNVKIYLYNPNLRVQIVRIFKYNIVKGTCWPCGRQWGKAL